MRFGFRLSIPTWYDGRLFRSKLEADWARAFDAIGLRWEYEKAGHYFDNTFYLPDFFLPASRQYVEVKGEWKPADLQKAYAMLHRAQPRLHTGEDAPDLSLVAANPEGVFWGFPRPTRDFHDFLLDSQRAILLQCATCGDWWFALEAGGWGCQCCGNGQPVDALLSPITPWPAVVREAA
jgi:hypothetical protein